MENASYALYIAIGVLVAIIILSVVLFRWKQIGTLESTKDDTVLIKNRADFNAEYEAYNKSLMYGTDVLSCLNKAQNNNQKYVYNNYYGTDAETMGKDDREEFFIDVEVTINSTLYDSVKAYYKDSAGKYKRVTGLSSNPEGNYDDQVFSGGTGNKFKIPIVYYYYFDKGLVYQQTATYTSIMWPGSWTNETLFNILKPPATHGSTDTSGQIPTTFEAGTYNLLEQGDLTTIPADRKKSAQLSALISTVDLKSQELTNSDSPTAGTKDDWWYCTWTTAASDFKTRKFRCTGTEYNSNNGYITKIIFEEYD